MTQHSDDQDDTDEALPRDLDDFLKTLKRRLADSKPRGWMRCASPRCRRERRCADDKVPCSRHAPAPPMTEDEHAETMAALSRELRAQMARR